MTAWHRNAYIKHMYEFTRQPLKIFDCVDFFYNELDVEESKSFLNVGVQAVIGQVAKEQGLAMHNGCMPIRLVVMPINTTLRTITFQDTHVKHWKKK